MEMQSGSRRPETHHPHPTDDHDPSSARPKTTTAIVLTPTTTDPHGYLFITRNGIATPTLVPATGKIRTPLQTSSSEPESDSDTTHPMAAIPLTARQLRTKLAAGKFLARRDRIRSHQAAPRPKDQHPCPSRLVSDTTNTILPPLTYSHLYTNPSALDPLESNPNGLPHLVTRPYGPPNVPQQLQPSQPHLPPTSFHKAPPRRARSPRHGDEHRTPITQQEPHTKRANLSTPYHHSHSLPHTLPYHCLSTSSDHCQVATNQLHHSSHKSYHSNTHMHHPMAHELPSHLILSMSHHGYVLPPGHTIAQMSHSQQTHHQNHLAPFSQKFRKPSPCAFTTMSTLHNQAHLTCTHALTHPPLAHHHPRTPGHYHIHNPPDKRHPRPANGNNGPGRVRDHFLHQLKYPPISEVEPDLNLAHPSFQLPSSKRHHAMLYPPTPSYQPGALDPT
ncbi:hypothetical protein H257_18367 [Aphanomyces astaci]|uniref:Uncharacterized protein n=1 Tax=Aphanomyces astaci TaxID=112090 RepID=W4FD77_APHAT|nr:hypothetical protein H257_18367 [Aphanomyces astaci]ETV64791.1 hypothetical protein H257_18367 [Aphanomyces astaci]|eukprot:XP_009845710.1 hypothetical protein H257_18367 [Aphanomyces astaci]